MMPSYLPWPCGLIWVSGVAEILGGIGLIDPRTRVLAAWGLIALLDSVAAPSLPTRLYLVGLLEFLAPAQRADLKLRSRTEGWMK